MALEFEDGIEVVGEAGDGAAAVAEVERLRPDVVLMDVRMPELDGIEATRRIVALDGPPIRGSSCSSTFDLEEYLLRGGPRRGQRDHAQGHAGGRAGGRHPGAGARRRAGRRRDDRAADRRRLASRGRRETASTGCRAREDELLRGIAARARRTPSSARPTARSPRCSSGSACATACRRSCSRTRRGWHEARAAQARAGARGAGAAAAGGRRLLGRAAAAVRRQPGGGPAAARARRDHRARGIDADGRRLRDEAEEEQEGARLDQAGRRQQRRIADHGQAHASVRADLAVRRLARGGLRVRQLGDHDREVEDRGREGRQVEARSSRPTSRRASGSAST